MLLFQVVQRRAKQQLDRVVMPLSALDDRLRWYDGVFGIEQEGLFGRKVPVLSEAFIAVQGAKIPKRCKPRGAVPRARSRTG